MALKQGLASADAVFRLAEQLLHTGAMHYPCIPDGSNPDGSPRLRPMTPREAVQRVFELAEELQRQGVDRGHLEIRLETAL